jgi:hypothetical protein
VGAVKLRPLDTSGPHLTHSAWCDWRWRSHSEFAASSVDDTLTTRLTGDRYRFDAASAAGRGLRESIHFVALPGVATFVFSGAGRPADGMDDRQKQR